jgi:hypothetical protein
MATALNLTLRLKQDAATQAALAQVKAAFAEHIQPAIDAALMKSEIVHFARVVVIDDKYIQVLTEFDGSKQVYTTFFLRALPEVFKTIFSLAEDVPPWEELQDEDKFYEVASNYNVCALGTKEDDDKAGYLFQALGNTTVKEIRAALAK